jgi:hypothetical protein
MVFCSITSWLAAILMMWTAGDWETYMEGMCIAFWKPCFETKLSNYILATQPYMNWPMVSLVCTEEVSSVHS